MSRFIRSPQFKGIVKTAIIISGSGSRVLVIIIVDMIKEVKRLEKRFILYEDEGVMDGPHATILSEEDIRTGNNCQGLTEEDVRRILTLEYNGVWNEHLALTYLAKIWRVE